eukprot:4471201-Amphidinium_carterae.1
MTLEPMAIRPLSQVLPLKGYRGPQESFMSGPEEKNTSRNFLSKAVSSQSQGQLFSSVDMRHGVACCHA